MTHSSSNGALRAQYAAAGFGGRVGWGARPALLVIDMTTAWVDPAQQLGSDLSGVMRSVQALLKIARTEKMPIYFTTMAYGTPAEIGSVVGCSTSGCIRGTCESAFNLNTHVIVPREAVGDRSTSAHEANLFDIDRRFADLMALTDVIAHLESSFSLAGAPAS